MYEQYTDKQIFEMLTPKLEKLGWGSVINNDLYPSTIKMISTIYRSAYIRGQLGRSFIIGEKKAKEPVNTFKVGDKVKFLGLNIEDEEALSNRRFYPPVNTIGKVTELGSDYCFIQWPEGTTADNGVWACRNIYLKKVTEHWVPATEDNVEVGSKVCFIPKKEKLNPEYFPACGTIGEVVSVIGDATYRVQWLDFTTSRIASRFDLEVLLCE